MNHFTKLIGTLIALLATSLAAQETVNSTPGMRLEWTHFIATSGHDNLGWLRQPFLDQDGMLYLAGITTSPDFPTRPDALYRTYKGGGRGDIFLLKFDTHQPKLVYSTFIPGTKAESVGGLWVDPTRNVYLAGITGSPDFPTTSNALHREFQGGRVDGFLTILGDDGRSLKYSTFLVLSPGNKV